MNRRQILLAATIPCLAGAVAIWMSDARLPASVEHATITIGGAIRNYRLVVPNHISRSSPLIFAFHGAGDSPDSMASYSQLDRLACQVGGVVVYPATQGTSWEIPSDISASIEDNPDVQLFDALTTRLLVKYSIAEPRVFLVGMSNGGSWAQLLAHVRKEKVAGVVSHSGICPANVPHSEVPLLLIVGADDPVVATLKLDDKRYVAAGHQQVTLVVVEGLGHEWSVAHNSDIARFIAN